MKKRVLRPYERLFVWLLCCLWLCGCAHEKRRDSPQFRACRAVCADEGTTIDAVVETEDHFGCYCAKAKEPGT